MDYHIQCADDITYREALLVLNDRENVKPFPLDVGFKELHVVNCSHDLKAKLNLVLLAAVKLELFNLSVSLS